MPEKYMRKPFLVDAMRITKTNMEEVVKWANGEIRSIEGQEPFVFVRVSNPTSERQTRGFVGDWVIYITGSGFKVYTHKSFKRTFEPVFKNEPEKPASQHPSKAIHQIKNARLRSISLVEETDGVGHVVNVISESSSTIPVEPVLGEALNEGEDSARE